MTEARENWIDLSGKTSVVTGASGGLGVALVWEMAALGAAVAMVDLRTDGLVSLGEEIGQAGGRAEAFSCDVSDEESVSAVAGEIERAFGPCDILINNAAVLRPGNLDALPLADWKRLLDVNLTGYLLCAQTFGKAMLERKSGSIVHVASIAGSQPQAYSGAYSPSKAAVIMLSRQFAFEWGPHGVRSNVVSPGLVRTPLSEDFYRDPATLEKREAVVPNRRIGRPEDIANTAAFLASNRAGYINGQEIIVDGGFSQTLMSHIPRPGYD